VSVRVRYAPSPTGFQHIGGVRTALYNYLFARSRGGSFILRIEDTDRERYVEEALRDIYETFAWLGIRWDEGPDVGGAKGPYRQSERLPIYREHAEALLKKGAAYRCYCSQARLEELRTAQKASTGGTGYDRHCRSLGEAERREVEERGVVPVVRLKVPFEGRTTFTDTLLGEISVENTDINPDPVLLKSDGFPTYHMANVVDDHLMEITYILRAQEWLPSAPLHRIIYDAFGWTQPVLCHLPMVMGSDGQKLSKRHGATSMREFRAQGYLPEAIVNYLALVGWSYDDAREFFSLADLESLFGLEKINKAPAVFDYQKLAWFNGSYIRKKSSLEFACLIDPVLRGAGFISGSGPSDGALLQGIAPLIQERVKLLAEVPEMVRFLFEEPRAPAVGDLLPKKIDLRKAREALERIDSLLSDLPESAEETERRFRGLAEELGMKLGDLLMPLRVAMTGAKVSPPLFESIRILGLPKTRARVAKAIAILAEQETRS
jgi:glutamyl-tRNA synthetase